MNRVTITSLHVDARGAIPFIKALRETADIPLKTAKDAYDGLKEGTPFTFDSPLNQVLITRQLRHYCDISFGGARRIDQAIAALHALNHTAVETDMDSDPEGFRIARELQLIEGVNPVPTRVGDAVLMFLGMAFDNFNPTRNGAQDGRDAA
jgi:hypothetical protein